jgi:hypothetical protein
VLAVAALQRLADGLLTLVWLPAPPIDLAIRWREVQRWFAGQPGYAGLTALGAAFQPASPLALLADFAGGAVRDAARASAQAHANLHSWLDALGLGRGHAPASLAALAALGWWMYRARAADLWIRLGVAALVARFWTFHYRYDDILVLLPVVALLRIVTGRPPGGPPDRLAAGLLGLAATSLLIPARLLFPPWPWRAVESAQGLIWLAALGLLLLRARREGAPRGARASGERDIAPPAPSH